MFQTGQSKKIPLSYRLKRNPFLCLAILAGLAFAALYFLTPESGSSLHTVLTLAWKYLGFGFHLAAWLLDYLLSGLPTDMEMLLIAVVGLFVYLLADGVWRYLW
jgi:hypothetical protein